jgi:UDPglucose 6-dehydrogenase
VVSEESQGRSGLMQICVLGTGYVGAVSGACLADIGHQVTCVDVDSAKADAINAGISPIHEEGLDDLLKRHAGNRLTATTDLASAMRVADVVLICVGTPFDGSSIDLTYILRAANAVGQELAKRDDWCVVAVKSTVVPGTTSGAVRAALEKSSGKRAGVHFGLGMNPEFLAEGSAVRDFMEPDRIVIGGLDIKSIETLADVYAYFSATPMIRTNTSTAEMIKYSSNALLATLISFSNEIAHCCEAFPDVDVIDVMAGVHQMSHLRPRKNKAPDTPVSLTSFLWPGCGFGGSCFPKDVKALAAQAASNQVAVPILNAVLDINAKQPLTLMRQLEAELGDVRGKKIAVLGLAFKPGTDDVRESPALKIVPELLKLGAVLVCHDPIATQTGKMALAEQGTNLSFVVFESNLDAALDGCEAAVLVTRWPEYQTLTSLTYKENNVGMLLVDGRRMIDPARYTRYVGPGRSTGRMNHSS